MSTADVPYQTCALLVMACCSKVKFHGLDVIMSRHSYTSLLAFFSTRHLTLLSSISQFGIQYECVVHFCLFIVKVYGHSLWCQSTGAIINDILQVLIKMTDPASPN